MLRNFLNKGLLEAGCDEAGRACLAGPVYAAAVILPPGFRHPLLRDSKELTHEQRMKVRPYIEKKAISWAVGIADHKEIDNINILNASFLAMHKAVDQLNVRPERLLIDGNRFNPYTGIPHDCIIGGDNKFKNIAAASILAKTYRDEFMMNLHHDYPCYDWSSNKGYPTRVHRQAIIDHGPAPYHRKSFRWYGNELYRQQELFDKENKTVNNK